MKYSILFTIGFLIGTIVAMIFDLHGLMIAITALLGGLIFSLPDLASEMKNKGGRDGH